MGVMCGLETNNASILVALNRGELVALLDVSSLAFGVAHQFPLGGDDFLDGLHFLEDGAFLLGLCRLLGVVSCGLGLADLLASLTLDLVLL